MTAPPDLFGANAPLIAQVAIACLMIGIAIAAALWPDPKREPRSISQLIASGDLRTERLLPQRAPEDRCGDVIELPLQLTRDQIVDAKDAELLDRLQRHWFDREPR